MIFVFVTDMYESTVVSRILILRILRNYRPKDSRNVIINVYTPHSKTYLSFFKKFCSSY